MDDIDKSAIFVSNNYEDFTDCKNKNQFHPDIKELLGTTEIIYQRILPAAINLSKKTIQQIEEYHERIRTFADIAVKSFTWDIQKESKGILMFLDVPYSRENPDEREFLTLTFAKTYSIERPDFISVIIPNNVSIGNGIFIKFGNISKNEFGKNSIELEKRNPIQIHFENCNDEYCVARIVNGFAFDETTNEKVDIFQKFLEYGQIFFLFIYPDGSHKSVAVPLFSFKEQYKEIKTE